MKLKNLKEATYSKQNSFVVQVFDPEDGVVQSYGPFSSRNEARKFEKAGDDYINKLFKEMKIPENYRDDLPHFNVEEIASPGIMYDEVKSDMESMFGEMYI